MAPDPPRRRSGEEERDKEEVEDADNYEDDGEPGEAPSHLPLAPSFELPDMSTTVDPSYIISLIRRLVPCRLREDKKDQKKDHESISSVQGIETHLGRAIEALSKPNNRFGNSKASDHCIGENEPLASQMDVFDRKHREGASSDGFVGEVTSEIQNDWEEYGCILWDLAASRSHAEFMVNNLLLEVILGTLHISISPRITEICLGILGNLACHDAVSDALVSVNGLIEAVMNQLFVNDSACLSETFRLLTSVLQGSAFACWAEALLPEQILLRMLWIVANTLNPTLLEKSIEFLLAIVEHEKVANILLQPLMMLDLPKVLLTLLACELDKLKSENKSERSSALELILHVVEGLSTTTCFSKAVSSIELLHIVCGVVKLPDKIEIATACASAVIIIANLLVDDQHLMSEFSQDFLFLHGLLDILPLVSDDPPARNALWAILAQLFVHVSKNGIDFRLGELVSIILGKSSLIEEDLVSHSVEGFGEDLVSADSCNKLHTMATSARKITTVLEMWIQQNPPSSGKNAASGDDNDTNVHRLLDYCRRYGI